MDAIGNLLGGNLTVSDRIWSAAAPALFAMAYAVLGSIVYGIRRLARGPYVDEEMQRRGSSAVLGMAVRQYFTWLMQPIWLVLRFARLPATALTTLSVLLASAAAVGVAAGRFALGGWLYILSGLCDFFDGRIARATGTADKRGQVLDSVLDRYSDSAMLFGLAWYYRSSWIMLAVGALLVGSFLVPYIRARGESLGVQVGVGLMQRPERIFYLGISVALSPIFAALYEPTAAHPVHHVAVGAILLLAVATLFTAGQRILYLLRVLGAGAEVRAWTSAGRGGLPRFAVASGAATAADFLLVVTLVEQLGLAPWVATFIGCSLGGAINFTINRLWVFAAHGGAGAAVPSGPRQLRRYAFVSATSALLNSGGVATLLLLPHLDYRIGWAIARAAVFLFWNYPLNRQYVFARMTSTDLGDAPAETRLAVPDTPSHGHI